MNNTVIHNIHSNSEVSHIMITRIAAAFAPSRLSARWNIVRYAAARAITAASCNSYRNGLSSRHEALLWSSVPRRDIHASVPAYAPKNKKGGKSGGGDSDANVAPVVLPDLKRLDAGMEDKIARMTEEFSKIRGGRVSPDMFKSLIVDVHGAKIPLAEAGQVTLATPTKLSVTTYDASAATPVANALRACGMGLNPSVEGGTVLATIPKPSAETRENFVKVAGKAAEKAKQDVRQVRKDGMDHLKKIKAQISEDDHRRLTKDLEALTEKKIDKIGKMLKDKEKEIRSE